MRELPCEESLWASCNVPVPPRTPPPDPVGAKNVKVVRPGIIEVDGQLETDLPLPKYSPMNAAMLLRDVHVFVLGEPQ